MDPRKSVPDQRGSPLRQPMGGAARNSYIQGMTLGQESHRFSQSREASFAATQGVAPRLYSGERALDDRHEELKRQIAMKEKLLTEMHRTRDSGRRLRYLNRS